MRPYTREAVEDELRDAFTRDDWERAALLERQLDLCDVPTRRATLLGAALWYAEHGIPVFPLRPGGKAPLPGSRGLLDATTDQDVVAAWWAKLPDANIGLATGHRFDVIDIDGPDGVAAIAAQVHLVRARSVGLVSTPRPGGLHYYVPHVEGRKNRTNLLPHVDTRGLGGYVVAPPSVTAQGSYRFLRPLGLP